MIDFKITYEDDEWIEFEITQPNNLIGNTEFWTDEDWSYWKNKMDELEKNGILGELETQKVKLKKNPFIDGRNFIGQIKTSKELTGTNGDIEQYPKQSFELRIYDAEGDRENKKLGRGEGFDKDTNFRETQGPEI